MFKVFKWIILKTIQLIERYEYRNLDLNPNDISKKILNSIEIDDLEVMTDTGWETISHIHTTQPFKIYKLETVDGFQIECADKHHLYDSNFKKIYIEDLKPGMTIKTINGNSTVKRVEFSDIKVGMFDLTVDSENHRYYTNGILSSNTICSGIYLCWFMLFHFDKNVLLMSNKGATTTEIMDKIREILKGLPFFLKPGIMKRDVMKMVFDNGCRIIAQNTTKNAGIGFTIHLLFLDEFAHVQENIKESFYENVYPTLSSSKISRIIITSTPNGYDLFQRLFSGAVEKTNDYVPFRVDWWEVPGRDEAWKAREVANLGSEEAFNKQYGCEFLSASSLLLDGDDMRKINKTKGNYEFREFDVLDDLGLDYSDFKWDKDFEEDELYDPNKYFVLSIDLGEGIGQDDSVLNIFRVDPLPYESFKDIHSPGGIYEYFKLKQIGVFSSNLLQIEEFAKVVYNVVVKIFDQENCKLVVEYNTYGSEFLRILLTLYPETNEFDDETIVRYYHRIEAKNKKMGFRHNSETKKLYCEKTKKNISKDRLEITDPQTIDQWKYFSKKKNGSYAAQTGKDDRVMTCVNVSSFLETPNYKEMVEEMFDDLEPEIVDHIENSIEGFENRDSEYDIFD